MQMYEVTVKSVVMADSEEQAIERVSDNMVAIVPIGWVLNHQQDAQLTTPEDSDIPILNPDDVGLDSISTGLQ